MSKVWILGPCSMENRENYFKTADHLNSFMGDRDWYFKASFDKANRTSLDGKRGPGLEEGLELFKEVKEKYPNTKLITDIHEVWQVEKLAGYVDCIQIPAFLCRQTDLIVECARHFDKINVKKGQWLGPNNLIKSVDKIKTTNPDCEAWICDRGSNFGYDKLLVDFTIVEELKQHYDRVILDCTHATQRSRAVYGSQGDRQLAERYIIASAVMGYNGVFAETHPNPPQAISDGDCQIYLDKIQSLVEQHEKVEEALC
jgi:2-dehydro-3-deoxyphosphooctonate aldolase (KDO 8-P synthase)|tara:strand:+ start:1468 stop:2238 length:771 start_codon:yes stop_codon:yes gene_type:complete